MTDPGLRDQRITIQWRPNSKTSSGADIPAAEPVLIAQVWARIIPAPTGKAEFYTADVIATTTIYLLDIPYVAGIEETMEVAWGSRTLDIIRVLDVGPRPLNLVFYAEERR